jgi:hypothetical protein
MRALIDEYYSNTFDPPAPSPQLTKTPSPQPTKTPQPSQQPTEGQRVRFSVRDEQPVLLLLLLLLSIILQLYRLKKPR